MFYRIVRVVVYVLAKILYRLEIKGGEHVPAEGPVICVANHANLLDPIFLGCSLKRPVTFMAKEELFRVPVLSWIIKKLGAIPVKRGTGDRGAFRTAMRVLQEDKVLGMFPEGTRYRDGKIHPLRPGAALLALYTGACILPVLIHGTHRAKFLRFPKIKVWIGKPFFLSPAGSKKETVREGTSKIYSRLVTLQGMLETAAR